MTVGGPWTFGAYQTLGIAKVWAGKAELPSTRRMWETYPGINNDLNEIDFYGGIGEEG